MNLIKPSVARMEKSISRIPFLVNLYSRPYRQVIKNEIELAQITAADMVLNIGCGAVPFTAIQIVSLTGAKVWAMDKDLIAVKQARFCLEQAGLSEQIEVIEGNGAVHIPRGFDVAVVALQAEPKAQILDKLLAGATAGGRLVFRKANTRFKQCYDHLPSNIKPVAEVGQHMQTFDSSVLYMKSGGKEEKAYAS